MGGLLYKDFVAVKGKRLVLTMIIATCLFIVLRMIFRGNNEGSIYVLENIDGELVNLFDTFFLFGAFFIIWMGAFLINNWGSAIMRFDDRDKTRGYLFSMPLNKRTYVASKYIFIAIVIYVVFSLFLIWNVTAASFMREGVSMDMLYLVNGFSVPFLCMILIMEAFEIPMFLLMGKEKAQMFKTAFWMALAMLAIAWFLFGDLDKIAGFDIDKIIKWIDAHEFEMMLMTVLSPIISLGIYYLSYLTAAGLYERKEVSDD